VVESMLFVGGVSDSFTSTTAAASSAPPAASSGGGRGGGGGSLGWLEALLGLGVALMRRRQQVSSRA
jgi:hypothetical protein